MYRWLVRAWVFRYTGDEEGYRQRVTKVLALAPGITNTNDQHRQFRAELKASGGGSARRWRAVFGGPPKTSSA